MEKLEEILRAEDSARRSVSDARTRAKEVVREAAAEAELITAQVKREVAEDGAELRARILREADGQASQIERDAEHALGEIVHAAESRMDQAATAVVDAAIG